VAKKAKKDKKAAKKADKKLNKQSKAAELASKAGAAIVSHPAVSEIVAATLVGAAAALKNPKKALALANAAGDDLQALTKEAATKGSALWALALEVGRKSLETLDLVPAEAPAKRRAARKPAARKAAAVGKPAAKRKAAGTRKPSAKRKAPAKKA
jgi:hypothetical protein